MTPIILDCDPGHDDAVAMVVAAATTELAGITTVAGNAPLAHCTANALAVAEVAGIDVEVHPGADRPLVRPARHAAGVHGESGLGGVDLPPTTRRPAPPPAVEWILEATRGREGLWLVATGPLTNVALALGADPSLPERIAGISLMGGAVHTGNVTPVAEFNVWFDPEAAAAVFASGVELRMCGLDVTHQVLVDAEYTDAVRAIGGPLPGLMADVMAAYTTAHRRRGTDTDTSPLHDPCAVLALTHPQLFDFRPLPVEVETDGRLTAGMTVVDVRPWTSAPATADVALGVDGTAVLAAVRDAIASSAGAGPGW